VSPKINITHYPRFRSPLPCLNRIHAYPHREFRIPEPNCEQARHLTTGRSVLGCAPCIRTWKRQTSALIASFTQIAEAIACGLGPLAPELPSLPLRLALLRERLGALDHVLALHDLVQTIGLPCHCVSDWLTLVRFVYGLESALYGDR
jgi:hypothetical protein